MKKTPVSKPERILGILALVLTLFGLGWLVESFARVDMIVLTHEDHDLLIGMLKTVVGHVMTAGIMVAIGIIVFLILMIRAAHRSARIRREAENLRRKIDAVEEINRKMQDLAHHQRLETIGTLTSSIAHEFNNLLTPIMGYSMMALEQLPPEEEELYDQILEIYNASGRAKKIISRLNDLARKNTSTNFRSVSVDEVVHKTMDVAMPSKPPRVQVRQDLNCWDQRIQANEIQINQMLLNLILNSFHAMEQEGGTLTVHTSIDEDNLKICVEDTGCGIPEELLPQIFEPFLTTKDAGKGTGLGLAIVAQVVEDHHGQIDVKSKVGEGTTVLVSLPRSPEPKESQ